MFERLGHFIVRHRKGVLASYIVAVIAAGAIGVGVFSALKSEGYDNPHSESAHVKPLLTTQFNSQDADAILIFDTHANVDLAGSEATATGITQSVSQEVGVARVVSYWSAGHDPALRSTDGNAGLAMVYFTPGMPHADATSLAAHIQATYDTASASSTTYVGGLQVLYHGLNAQITSDLAKAESIAIPLNILMLLIIFGTAVSAGLPMIVALGSISGSFFFTYLVTQVTDVSIFAINLITGLGLGLGIDYALLIVNRFREELHHGKSVEDAVSKSVSTAGRTVFFSGVTVALVLASLTVFPLYFLKSFAYAGVSVVIFAVLSSIIALPAVLAILGHRVDKMKIRRGDLAPKDEGA